VVILKGVSGLRMGSFEGLARGGRGGFVGLVRVLRVATAFGFVEVVGVGIFEGLDEVGVEFSEGIGESGAQGLATEGVSEFVFGHGKSLGHDLSQVSEGMSRFRVDLATGHGPEEAAETPVEGTGADVVGADARGDVVPGVLGGEAL